MKIRQKIMALMMTTIMVGTNLLSLGAQVIASAPELENQNKQTNNANVEFNSYLEGEVHSKTFSEEEEAKLYLYLNVKENGYLKNGIVEFVDANYQIETSEISGESIQKVEENQIQFKQINSNQEMTIEVPIHMKEQTKIAQDNFSKISKVVLKGTYVNANGREIAIEKEISNQITWKKEASVEITGEITKYIPYQQGEEYGVFVQAKINSGVKEHVLPIQTTNLEISVPQLNGTNPERVTVVAKSTKGTNGIDNGNAFTTNNYQYNQETGKVTIQTQNQADDQGKVAWEKANDEYFINYLFVGKEIYDVTVAQLEEAKQTMLTEEQKEAGMENENAITGDIQVVANLNLYNGEETVITFNGSLPYAIEDTKGSLTDLELVASEKINKGYLYANYEKTATEKQETTFTLNYATYIYDTNINNKIQFTESKQNYVADENEHEIGNNAITKQVKISQTIFQKILGEEGKLQVLTSDGTLLGEITKDTQIDAHGNYVLNIEEAKVNQITITTSSPIMEGKLEVQVEKALVTEQSYSLEEMKSFSKITLGVTLKTNNENKTAQAEITMQEPVSKAEISIEEDKQNLSTMIVNKDVDIRVVLDTSSTENALFKNPTFEIELPSQIEKVEVKDVNLLLEDELEIKETKVEERSGKKVIIVTLEGTQTKYTNYQAQATGQNNVITKGANIIINTDLTLNQLAPSATETINLYYTNENTDLYEKTYQPRTRSSTQTRGMASTTVNLVAPTGVVTANSMSGYDANSSELMNIGDEIQTATIETYGSQREVTVEGIMTNNYTNAIDNVMVLGRVPFTGNKAIDETEELGSTFDMPMTSTITTSGIDSGNIKIYYSENGEATRDLIDSNNGWTENPSDLSKVKSYLIVISGEVTANTQMSFSYKVSLPANLSFNQSSYANYKVYYDNKAPGATIGETKKAGVIGLTTGEGPELEVKLSASIPENTVVRPGQYIRYYVEVTNKGKADAQNVKVTAKLPMEEIQQEDGVSKYSNLQFVEYEEYNNNYTPVEGEELTLTIPTVKAGETETIDYEMFVKAANEEETLSFNQQVTVTADKVNTNIASNEYQMQLANGGLSILNRSSSVEQLIYTQGDVITYKIYFSNFGNSDINNIIANVPIPENATVQEAYAMDINNNRIEAQIVTQENQVVANMGNIVAYGEDKILVVQFELGEKAVDSFSTKITATANENETYYSNERFVYLVATSSISGKQIEPSKLDVDEGEEFEYQFTISTKGEGRVTGFVLEDTLPQEIQYVDTTIEIVEIPEGIYNGASSTTIKDNILTFRMESIAPNTTFTVKFTVKGRLQNGETEKQIVNSAIMYADAIEQVKLNDVTMYLHYNNDVHDTDDQIPETPENNRYRITGTAWLDSNQNGQRDENETFLAGIEVLLLDKQTSQIVQDVDTKQNKTTTTNGNGYYEFNNLVSDEYLVVFLYDSGTYSITEYQKEGVNDNFNNDAISMKVILNGEQRYAGVTDTIRVTNQSQRNLDIGLYTAEKFDMRLDKYVTEITLTTPTIGTNTYTYGDSQLERVEILAQNVNKSNIIIKYKIVVTNEGQVPGYVKKIIDYLPDGTSFNSEINQDWYISDNNRTVFNTSLENTKINPGESKEVELVLSLTITDENIGNIVNNNAEIYETYNEQGLTDIDSTEANQAEHEDDMSKADIVLSVVTGKIVMYSILGVVILAMLITGIILIQKKVFKKKQ